MPVLTNDMLIEAIKNTQLLQAQEKEFLNTRLDKMDHLDKFKLKRYLIINDEKTIRETFRIIRDKIIRDEKEKEFFAQNSTNSNASKLVNKLAPKQENNTIPVSISILSDVKYLGHDIDTPPEVRGEPFRRLEYFSNLDQLSLLESSHVTFSLDDEVSVIIQKFLNKLTELFNNLDDIKLKRSYFRLFMRSSLFNSYLNTGITALRHVEIQPRKIALNLIYQTDPIYLNTNQFEYTSTISNHLKDLAEV
jgi:hypothetical protein